MTETKPLFSVLVVDDEPDLISSIRRILRLDGYRVESSSSLVELMTRQDLAEFFAILLDRKLPDGLSDTILPQLRSVAPDASLIIITGYADLESSLIALRHGASDYLLKPIDPDHLRKRLAALVDLRRAKHALSEANQRLVQSERLAAIGQMMTALIHESRNSLQCTQACLETLSLNLTGDTESLELVARMQKAQHKLHTLFEEVRNYAAPIKLNLQEHNLFDILDETWDNLIWSRQGRQVELFSQNEVTSPRCRVDAVRIEQVFRNVLENSLAACCDPVRIEVRCSRQFSDDKPMWVISFRDNGPGLTSEQRERMFDPFFTTKSGGTGLGLPISRRLIEAHGGKITASTGIETGTEIVVMLPALKDD